MESVLCRRRLSYLCFGETFTDLISIRLTKVQFTRRSIDHLNKKNFLGGDLFKAMPRNPIKIQPPISRRGQGFQCMVYMVLGVSHWGDIAHPIPRQTVACPPASPHLRPAVRGYTRRPRALRRLYPGVGRPSGPCLVTAEVATGEPVRPAPTGTGDVRAM